MFEIIEFQLRILNHAPDRLTYRVNWNLPKGWALIEGPKEFAIGARQEGTLKVKVRPDTTGLHIITADIAFAGRELKRWTEALVRVR